MKKTISLKWRFVALLIFSGALFLVFSSLFVKSTFIKKYDNEIALGTPYYLPVKEALKFAEKSGLDTSLAVFINYRKHSGRKRLYIINLIEGIATDSFMVAHGCGTNNWGSDASKENPIFSNEPESHCSSLGKYRIGKRAHSDWGINVKYFLFGLERGNSNAYRRTIVLHGWGDVSDDETYPTGTPEGWGCPAVSNHAMHTLDSLLKQAGNPVLLWTY